MKFRFSTVVGAGALGSGIVTGWPLLVDAWEKGRIAWDLCFVPISIFGLAVTAVLSHLWLYLKPSPTQPKP